MEQKVAEIKEAIYVYVATGATEIDTSCHHTHLCFGGQLESHLRRSPSVQRGLWKEGSLEDDPSHRSPGYSDQRSQGQSGLFDGGVRLYQDVHWEGVCECHLSCCLGDGAGNTWLLPAYGVQGRLQTSRRDPLSQGCSVLACTNEGRVGGWVYEA